MGSFEKGAMEKDEIPCGLYCADFGDAAHPGRCRYLRSKVGGEEKDGADHFNPSTLVSCSLFGEGLAKCYPYIKDHFYGLTVKKCQTCLHLTAVKKK